MKSAQIGRVAQYADAAATACLVRHLPAGKTQHRLRRHLVDRLGRMKGIPQKLGQILSFGEDNDGSGFSQLQERGEPLPFRQVEQIVEREWGRRLDEVVREFNRVGKPASLGQVHRATLIDGREVAVKVQYPRIEAATDLDLSLLGCLSVPVGNLNRGFNLAGYREAIQRNLREELDYRQEARWQTQFAQWARDDSFVVVPTVHDELTTERILVTSWEDGEHWNAVHQNWSDAEKRQLAAKLVAFFHEGLFELGAMHADWHPGNLRFRRTGAKVQLLLYDFGCVYAADDATRLGLVRLIEATISEKSSPYPIFLLLGFDPDFLGPIADQLPALCRVLFEPYCANYPYELADWQLGNRVNDVLGDDRWNFRIAGPPSLVFLMRAFQGLLHYVRELGQPVAWNHIVGPILNRHREAAANLTLPQPEIVAAEFTGLAKSLKIKISEGAQTKVQLTHRASAIDRLDEFLGQELKERIERRCGSLAEIVANVRRNGYRPSQVFELQEGDSSIRVWLE